MAQPSSEQTGSLEPQLFRTIGTQLRQLRMISDLLLQLETLSAQFEPSYWSRRCTLRGMVDSVTLAHQVRVLVSPVGEDLGRLR